MILAPVAGNPDLFVRKMCCINATTMPKTPPHIETQVLQQKAEVIKHKARISESKQRISEAKAKINALKPRRK